MNYYSPPTPPPHALTQHVVLLASAYTLHSFADFAQATDARMDIDISDCIPCNTKWPQAPETASSESWMEPSSGLLSEQVGLAIH